MCSNDMSDRFNSTLCRAWWAVKLIGVLEKTLNNVT